VDISFFVYDFYFTPIQERTMMKDKVAFSSPISSSNDDDKSDIVCVQPIHPVRRMIRLTRTDETAGPDKCLMFEFPLDKDGPEQYGWYVNQVLVSYNDVEKDMKGWFSRIRRVEISRDGMILHEFSGNQWGSWMTLCGFQTIRRESTSETYIMLPGTLGRLSRPTEIRIYYTSLKEDAQRTDIMAEITDANGIIEAVPKQGSFWSMLWNKEEVLSPDQKQCEIDLSDTITWDTRQLAQIVLFTPGIAMCLLGGVVKLNDHVIHSFDNAHEATVMDKLLRRTPFVRIPLLTCTFANWIRDRDPDQSQDRVFMPTLREKDRLVVVLNINLEDLPKNAKVWVFAVVSKCSLARVPTMSGVSSVSSNHYALV
jgi:hypothetical protein